AAGAAAAAEGGRRRHWLVAPAATFGLLATACLGGFGWFADRGSHLAPGNPPKADAIIVLTGGHSRLDAAMALLESGKGERLLISGVHPSATRTQLQRSIGSDERLFACCVNLERTALATIGNATESAKWVESHAYD